MALYQKLPRSRLKSNMDGEDTIVPYRKASPKAKASAAPYSPPPSTRKGDRLSTSSQGGRQRKPAEVSKGASEFLKRVVTNIKSTETAKGQRGLRKGSMSPTAYSGGKGDTKKARGAVTTYMRKGK